MRRFNGGEGVKGHSSHCQIRSMEWGGVRRFNGGEGVKDHSYHCQIRSMEWGGGVGGEEV